MELPEETLIAEAEAEGKVLEDATELAPNDNIVFPEVKKDENPLVQAIERLSSKLSQQSAPPLSVLPGNSLTSGRLYLPPSDE